MPTNLMISKTADSAPTNNAAGLFNPAGQDSNAYAFSADEEGTVYDSDPNTLELVITPS